MDAVGLATLRDELAKDCEIAAGAFDLARQRLDEGTDAALDSSAHHLARLYNIIEQMALRVGSAFENSIEDERGWHAELIRRMTLRIGGVRPAFFPEQITQELRELRAFRHVFTHAYDLRLDPAKLRLLVGYAHAVIEALAASCERFVREVAEMHGISGVTAPEQ